MTAVVNQPWLSTARGPEEGSGWFAAPAGFSVKVLAADAVALTAEYLARLSCAQRTGPFRHLADTFVYIMDGELRELETGALYTTGDCCCQPAGVIHDLRAGADGVTIYVNQRADVGRLIEFCDATGVVFDVLAVSTLAAHVRAVTLAEADACP